MQVEGELEKRVEHSYQAEAEIEEIQESCELMFSNLGKLSLSNKHIALEALVMRVIAEQGNVRLEGSIPIVSTALRQHC